jgi:hypothetical protein
LQGGRKRTLENYGKQVKFLLYGSWGPYHGFTGVSKYVSTLAHEAWTVNGSQKTCAEDACEGLTDTAPRRFVITKFVDRDRRKE